MKRAIMLVSFILICSFCFAQKLSLTDIFAMKGMSQDDFDTYVSKHGYYFHQRSKADNGVAIVEYASQQVNPSKAKYFVNRLVNPQTGSVAFGYQTYSQAEYIAFKEKVKEMGYTLIGDDGDSGGTSFTYRKDKSTITLLAQTTKNELGTEVPIFQIMVF